MNLASRTDALGRTELYYEGMPALPRVAEKTRWTPRDAASMIELTTRFYADERGVASVVRHAINTFGDPDKLNIRETRIVGERISGLLVANQSSPDFMTVFADEGFASMMHAASLSSPKRLLSMDELPSQSGAIFFETPQDLSGLRANPLDERRGITTVRGIEWFIIETEDEPLLWWGLLVDPSVSRNSFRLSDPNVVFPEEYTMYTSLYGMAAIYFHGSQAEKDDPETVPQEQYGVASLLRALGALAKSPQTVDRPHVPSRAERKKAGRRNRRMVDREVRVLSLVNPEHGRYELDAATGRKLRAHWVRGHWRNQWYATAQEHKTIWVDGFVRGDASIGTVGGARVYAARAPKGAEPKSNQERRHE